MVKLLYTFPYQYKKINEGQVVDPFIFLPIKTRYGWQNLWFLLDSGADVTMLTVSLAEVFGLKYDIKKEVHLIGIGEDSIVSYPGNIEIKMGRKKYKIRAYFINNKNSTLLLGRLDLFDKLSIQFNHEKKAIEFFEDV